jgi:hypothetical protein
MIEQASKVVIFAVIAVGSVGSRVSSLSTGCSPDSTFYILRQSLDAAHHCTDPCWGPSTKDSILLRSPECICTVG